MKCFDCKFYVLRKLDEFEKKFYSKDGTGFCHRYPSKVEKGGEDWCGEFKLTDKTIRESGQGKA